MSERQVVPVGLATMPPGPALAAVLAAIDRTRLSADDLHELVAAWGRQLAHDNAQLLAAVYEAGLAAHRTGDTLERNPDIVDRAEVQVAWTLRQSESTLGGSSPAAYGAPPLRTSLVRATIHRAT